MDGVVVNGMFKWSRKKCAKQMPSKPQIKITADGKKETRVFATEFARRRVMINEDFATKAFHFQYEQSDFPPAVFHNGQMRKVSKHTFLNYLCCTCDDGWIVEEHTLTEPNAVYDGGVFLQNLISIWKHGRILGNIADQYVSHAIRPTGQSQELIVVFDGYLGNKTK